MFHVGVVFIVLVCCWFAVLVSKQLWDLLQFYKNYNVFRAIANHSHGFHQTRLRKTEAYLANRMKAVFNQAFEVREEKQNALSHVFPASVTGCVDTFPIFIKRPKSSRQKLFYNGKYKGHVLKVTRQHARHRHTVGAADRGSPRHTDLVLWPSCGDNI